MLNFENLDKFVFPGVGKYNIPQIEPVHSPPNGEFIPANYAKTAKDPGGKIIHCFVDDYQFVRLWNQPDRYIPMIRKFAGICAPDFSMYTDMPLAMQIYNHYRKHWLAAYWQLHGIKVYPTIGWSTPDSYDWCFDGEPEGGIVAVSSVGTQANKRSKQLFMEGYGEMLRRLRPSKIIFYGAVPEGCSGDIIRIRPHQDEIKRKSAEKRAETENGG